MCVRGPWVGRLRRLARHKYTQLGYVSRVCPRPSLSAWVVPSLVGCTSSWANRALAVLGAWVHAPTTAGPVSYTHLTLPTTPDV